MNFKNRKEQLPGKELALASIRRRFIAFLLDWMILIFIYVSIILLFALFGMSISKINVHSIVEVDVETENTPVFVITLLKIMFGLLPVLYFACSIYFRNGQTIGKYLLRIRVLSIYHTHLGFWHCIERSLGYFASALEFGLGYFQAFWNPNRMSLHDKIGETVVVKLSNKNLKSKK